MNHRRAFGLVSYYITSAPNSARLRVPDSSEAKLRAFRSSLGKYYEVQVAGCDTYWSIGAFGISEEELVTVVEGLRIRQPKPIFSSESANGTSAARAHCNVLMGMLLLILVFAGACSEETDQSQLPEDPCAVLDRREVESVLESKVTTVERVPSIDQVIEQQNKGGAASDVPQEARRLCSYTTTGPVGSVIVGVFPDEAAQRFGRERKNAENVQGLGNDAYFLDRGNRVQVLVGDSQMLSIYFQQPAESETAQSLLSKLVSRALKASSQAAAMGDPKSAPSSSRLA